MRMKGADAAIVFGAILPDLPIFIFFAWYSFIDSKGQDEIWRTLYFDPRWQIFFDLFNSIPLFSLILLIAWRFSYTRWVLFSAASLLHFAEDFFIHMEDAHAHFFPFSSYRFISSISYWDGKGYGNAVSMAETAVVLVISYVMYGHIRSWWGKGLLIAANLSLLGSHAMWMFIFRYA